MLTKTKSWSRFREQTRAEAALVWRFGLEAPRAGVFSDRRPPNHGSENGCGSDIFQASRQHERCILAAKALQALPECLLKEDFHRHCRFVFLSLILAT